MRNALNNNGTYLHCYRGVALFMCFLLLSFFAAAQERVGTHKVITSEFAQKEVQFEKSSIISNVLKIKNNNGKPYKFRIQVSTPRGWKSTLSEERVMELNPGDSIFIPVRVVPNFSSVAGSTKYTINAAIMSVDGKIMSTGFFFANKPAISNWQMKILPRPRIYFLNGENSANFQVSLSNDGDETKNVLLSMNTVGRGISIGDSSFNKLRKQYTELFLKPYMDTLLPFSVTIQLMKKNFKRLDIDGYMPNQTEEEKNYMLFAKAGEIGNSINRVEHNQKVNFIRLSNSINFVKLGDDLKVNANGSATIPLTANLDVYNLLSGSAALSNLNLYGNMRNASNGLIAYQLQSNLTGFNTPTPAKQTFGSIGYYTEKGYIQGGNVGAGLYGIQGVSGGVGGGLGLSVGYFLTSFRKIAAYISEGSSGPFSRHVPNYGVGYQDRITKHIKYSVAYKHNDNGLSFRSDIVQGTTSLGLGKSQGIAFIAGQAANDNYATRQKTTGNSVGMSYNGTFFKRMLSTDLNITNFDKNFSGTGLGSIVASSNTFLRTKGKWGFSLQDQYSTYDAYMLSGTTTVLGQNKVFYNQLNLNKKSVSPVNISYFLYYNYTDYANTIIDGKGAGINGSFFQSDKNFRVQMLLKGGYNKQYNPDEASFFSAQYFSLINYHTLFFNVNYTYSAQTATNSIANAVLTNYPQQLMLSLSHQLQLGKQIIWENNVNYNYLSNLQKNNIGVFSTMYFYTYSGWRFKLEGGYNRSSTESYQYDYAGPGQAPILSPTNTKVVSTGFQVNVGMRKQFNIRLPDRFSKQKFCNAKFVAFLDLNGNKIMDQDEVPLENVVIRLNELEIITNKTGQAQYENVTWGKYRLQAFSLIDLGAWFPVIADSVDLSNVGTYYVPFSKGVKIQGNIETQREKYSGEIYSMDLSKIKITLNDTLGKNVLTSITDNKGNFSFYAPYGNYVLSMDEEVLSSDFTIAQNNIRMELLDGMDNFYYTFFILENKRRVTKKKFDTNGNLISENTDVADVYTGSKTTGNAAQDNTNGNTANTNNKSGRTNNTSGNNNIVSNSNGTTGDTLVLLKRDKQKVTKRSPDVDRLKDIDEKITRIDSVGNLLLKKSASGFYTTQVVAAGGAPKMLQSDIANNKTPSFTIEVAYYPSGDNMLERLYSGMASHDKNILLDGINSGELKWYFHPDGGTSIIYGSFTNKQDAVVKRANLLKMGYPANMQIKVMKQNKLLKPDGK